MCDFSAADVIEMWMAIFEFIPVEEEEVRWEYIQEVHFMWGSEIAADPTLLIRWRNIVARTRVQRVDRQHVTGVPLPIGVAVYQLRLMVLDPDEAGRHYVQALNALNSLGETRL